MRHFPALLLALTSACAYEYTWEQTHATLPPAQGERCYWEIRDELPPGEYVLLAEFTARRHPADAPRSEEGLRASVEKMVCELGGTIVLTKPNPQGHYGRGKVFVSTP
jgi:hypothetical protein